MEFPRQRCLGYIEAPWISSISISFTLFPRQRCLGYIEAYPNTASLDLMLTHFRGNAASATLKLTQAERDKLQGVEFPRQRCLGYIEAQVLRPPYGRLD